MRWVVCRSSLICLTYFNSPSPYFLTAKEAGNSRQNVQVKVKGNENNCISLTLSTLYAGEDIATVFSLLIKTWKKTESQWISLNRQEITWMCQHLLKAMPSFFELKNRRLDLEIKNLKRYDYLRITQKRGRDLGKVNYISLLMKSCGILFASKDRESDKNWFCLIWVNRHTWIKVS